ncbi:hypothetical protein [Pseudomonas luteola]|uniref:hypothetical protein n=1 Tax=Pseudomonas luteola TaxID=47886 RepID=UPI0015EBF4F3|nr:hypothetical protein [Pseudomonas luteola]MCG7374206.1 hypothetical protein [Pseudomonas luteola]
MRLPCAKGERFLPADRVTTGWSKLGRFGYALACFIFRFLRRPLQRAASRALPSHGIAPETTNGWRIERRTARGDRQILDFPLERLTVICCDIDMDEGEWRRLLRATCQRLMMTTGHLCLHAVVARLHGKTFAIAGGHGTGKSSLGALLHEQGGELLSFVTHEVKPAALLSGSFILSIRVQPESMPLLASVMGATAS